MQGQERVTTLPLVGSASSLAASGTRRTGVNDPLIGRIWDSWATVGLLRIIARENANNKDTCYFCI